MYKKVDMKDLKLNTNFRWWLDRKNFISEKECSDLIERIDRDCERKVKNAYDGKSHTGKQDPAVCNLNVALYTDENLMTKYWNAFYLANQLNFKFDIVGLHNNEYTGHKYEVGDWYTPHSDFHPSGNFSIVKLTSVLFLNDEYEGGDFKFFDNTIVDPEPGRLIIFPSFAGHEVKPITKGVRYTSVCWAVGNTFK